MNKKLLAAIIVIVVIIVAGAAFMLSGNSSEGTVKIGYLPSDHDAALFIADAQGIYNDKGISVELVQFNNGGDLMTAMASGEVDVGYVGITPVLSSIEKGVPVKVVSGVQTEGSGLAVSEASGITQASDLKGKSIATPGEASIQYMLLQYYLKQNGMSVDDLKVSAMKVAPMNDALNSNKIDGMLTYEPYVTTATENGHKLLVNSSEILPGHPCCVVAASDKFIADHPDELKDLIDAHKEATDIIKKDSKGAASQLPKEIVSNVTLEEKALGGINFISGLDASYKQSIMDFMNLEVELGILKEPLSEQKIFWNGN
ncbi:MAG: ABC transporter substrate-binding protein [Methanobrevibacter sp.]|uniref:ABC transporter substrate-binding protein n=1 Tax=Methanobrevibacter sp. TaxID=66852 RepID=UPI0026DEDECF|nr:ABC transporter substrate-binding protein [Methanobrevibacter sp.]MDO5848720.1 ABC transporter substrate-binding protein [Methanobrevibacter sp.]